MNRLTKFSTALLATAVAMPGLVAAEGDTTASASFESVAVSSPAAGTISATGVTTFGGETVVVATDDSGDGTLPGTDMGTFSIGQDTTSGDLIFSMGLNDGLPTTGTIPVGLYYEWTQSFPGAGDVALRATWAQYDAPDAEFNFDVAVTVDTTFTPTIVSGEYTGTELIWYVPTALLGVQPGHTLTGLAEVNFGGAGLFTLGGQAQDDALTGKFVVGGGARLVVTDASGEVVDETTAKVRRGEFTASIKDLDPGTYTAEVFAEYGDASSVETFTVTVA